MRSIGRPLMPPALLMRSTAICVPTSAVLPPAEPESGCGVPILIGLAGPNAACHGAGTSMVAPSAPAAVPQPISLRRVTLPRYQNSSSQSCLSVMTVPPWSARTWRSSPRAVRPGPHQQTRFQGHIQVIRWGPLIRRGASLGGVAFRAHQPRLEQRLADAGNLGVAELGERRPHDRALLAAEQHQRLLHAVVHVDPWLGIEHPGQRVDAVVDALCLREVVIAHRTEQRIN